MSVTMSLPAWRPMIPADLPAIVALADLVHADYPEERAVLAEKLALFPYGCLTLEDRSGAGVTGYCFSHPWTKDSVPKLNTMLGALPAAPSSYFIHDVAMHPDWRNQRLGRTMGPLIRDVSRLARLFHLSLVSVHRSRPFWQRLGFVETPDVALQQAVRASYSDAARHMHLTIDPHFETGR